MAGFIKVVVALTALVASIAAGGESLAQVAQPPTAKPEMMESCPGLDRLEPAARDAGRGALRARWRSGARSPMRGTRPS